MHLVGLQLSVTKKITVDVFNNFWDVNNMPLAVICVSTSARLLGGRTGDNNGAAQDLVWTWLHAYLLHPVLKYQTTLSSVHKSLVFTDRMN